MEDLQQYGCVSGMVSNLIYYDDTNKFYDEYREEINELLSETLNMTGLSINELFGKNFDSDDPLILDYSNKNLLAWFGFEETLFLHPPYSTDDGTGSVSHPIPPHPIGQSVNRRSDSPAHPAAANP